MPTHNFSCSKQLEGLLPPSEEPSCNPSLSLGNWVLKFGTFLKTSSSHFWIKDASERHNILFLTLFAKPSPSELPPLQDPLITPGVARSCFSSHCVSHQEFRVLPSLFCLKCLLCNVMPSKRASGNRSPVSWFWMSSLKTIYNPGLFGSSTSVRKTSSWHRESVSSLVKYVPGFQFEFIFCSLCFSLLYSESFNVIFFPEDNFISWTSYPAIIKTDLNLY